MNQSRLNNVIITGLAKTKQATLEMATLPAKTKNKILAAQARALIKNSDLILRANRKDFRSAKNKRCTGAFLDRLRLDKARIIKMSESLRALIDLKDPVGEVIKKWRAPAGFLITKVRVPLGVVLIIYESRPDVTSDCIGLCIKSGNCLILRGGSEAINSNQAIFNILSGLLGKFSVNRNAINFVSVTERRAVDSLLKMNDYIDVVIPRGGKSLIRKIYRSSRIPVIKHYEGICHTYVDERADLDMAVELCFNAKVQRPGTCNAMETMLVHKDIAEEFLPRITKKLFKRGVKIRACARSSRIIKKFLGKSQLVSLAKEADYYREYLDLVLNIKVVNDLAEAIKHINYYGSRHTDAVITKNREVAKEFLKKVDSACVYHNLSTRFTDGYQFGMGAEIGISTDRLHARGPVALEELTTYKYVAYGRGEIRT